LFGFDFVIKYRPVHLNSATDALSRRDDNVATTHALFGPSFGLLDDIRAATSADPEGGRLLQQLADASLGVPWQAPLCSYTSDLCHQVVALAHTASHEGIQKTLVCLCKDFYIPDDRVLVQDFIRTCVTCQRNKTPTLQAADLLQPLDMSSQVWADISMDFIDGLPKVHGKLVILTVVDRFSKYAHFIALSHP
jgi:hypothetical protein